MYLISFCSFFLFLSLPADASSFSMLPSWLQRTIQYDQNYNVAGYPSVKQDAKNFTVNIHARDYPVEALLITRSSDVSQETLPHFFVKHNGKDYVRLFDSDLDLLPVLDGAIDVKGYVGTKFLSHKTYLVWGYKDPQNPFFVKMGDPTDIAKAQSAHLSVPMSQFVTSEVSGDREAGYPMAEILTTSLRDHQHYYNIIREVTPRGFDGFEGFDLMPMHGLIGGLKTTQYHTLAGYKDIYEWYGDEVITKMGRWHAALHFKYGIWPEGHTQNTLAIIDNSSGSVVGFAFRDAFDMAIEPMIRYINEREPLPAILRQGSVINNYFVEGADLKDRIERAQIARFWKGYYWGFDKIYNSKWLGFKVETHDFEGKYLAAYQQAAQRITGDATFKIAKREHMGNAYQKLLTSLLSQPTTEMHKVELNPNVMSWLGRRYQYGTLVLARSEMHAFAKNSFAGNYALGFEAFYDGAHMVVYHNKTPFGLAYEIFEWERKELGLPKISPVIGCRALQQRLRN